MHPESFEHEQNIPASHKNVPEYLECTQNAVKIFKMQFDYHYRNFHSEGIVAHSGTGVMRVFFDIHRVVQQGGILSPFVYDLLKELRLSGYGTHLGNLFIGSISM